VTADGGTIATRSAVQFGAALAGLAIEHSMLGAVHALANPLTAEHGLVHGLAVGVMLPHVVRFNGAACGAAYADLLDDLGLSATADEAGTTLADWLTGLLAASRMKTSLRACGIDAPDISALAAKAAEQWTAGFNPRPVTAADLAALYEAAR
jgi:alcohol dehydrogenase